MQCPSCGGENAEGAKFCEECGSPFVRLCPSCGQQMRPAAKFCPECGTPLQAIGKPKPAKRRKSANPTGRPSRPAARSAPVRPRAAAPEAERRQLTVLFCDLVGSTALSTQLDPEELREVVRAYQEICTTVIQHYEGYVAQHLGDGLLVYFGYPTAHEDDARRAVHAGLEMIEALREQATQQPLRVRIGIHTGLVVIGEIGNSENREILALGETPNVAARIQGQAAPDEVMISATTYRLVKGFFACEARGRPELKGVATPLLLYQVMKEEEVRSRFEVVARSGLTPLVGREHEYGLLRERWERVKDGPGQIVLLSGEPGIGKSRLVEALKETVEQQGARCLELHCSPYAQNSALQPVIEHLQRVLQFQLEDSANEKLRKLEEATGRSPLQAETISLLAALLSLPHPQDFPVLTLSPQKQKEKTQEALVAWLFAETTQQAVACVWEDLHWADPSTLELLTLFLQQVPTTRLLTVLTFRPEFVLPWGAHSYVSQLTLSRLGRSQVETMVRNVTGGNTLTQEVVQQIVNKTDGVPLFVEELTKSVMESVGSIESGEFMGAEGKLSPSSGHMGIPVTLQDALMARLDRLGSAKEIAQVGAVIGGEVSYDVLRAAAPVGESMLQQGLRQLVAAELLYQRGVPPQSTYLFKHALVQDTAYQSLLKSTRQHLHSKIAQVLEERFSETKDTQPELLAHHYTEAGLLTEALPYWQRAGERAAQRSAYVEAISHLTTGLGSLTTLADTPKRVQQELPLQLALSNALLPVRGYAAPEVEKAVTRARALCHQLGETPQLFPVLFRLWVFYFMRRELQTARELAEQLMRLAQSVHDRYLLSLAHAALGMTSHWLGELPSAWPHLEQAIALYDPQQHPGFTIGTADHRVDCLSHAAWTLWRLGYLDQALKRSQEALALAAGLAHPYSLTLTLGFAAVVHLLRGEGPLAQERAEAVMTLSTEQGFPTWLAEGTMVRGGALAAQGQVQEGITQMEQGLATLRAMGTEPERLGFLSPLLAAAYAKVEQVEAGLSVLAEALTFVDRTGMRVGEAELYRLKGVLTLQSKVQGPPPTVEKEAEACFLKAIEIAQKQQAKSLELRAVVSLARLWQQQGKIAEAHALLVEVYGWFTEGFDTKDLQEAKALLEELA
jgi:class 3 adenylate cyclase/predicted ATPase